MPKDSLLSCNKKKIKIDPPLFVIGIYRDQEMKDQIFQDFSQEFGQNSARTLWT